jgi:hypothetical protein
MRPSIDQRSCSQRRFVARTSGDTRSPAMRCPQPSREAELNTPGLGPRPSQDVSGRRINAPPWRRNAAEMTQKCYRNATGPRLPESLLAKAGQRNLWTIFLYHVSLRVLRYQPAVAASIFRKRSPPCIALALPRPAALDMSARGQASRINGAKSRGPTTPEGKARSSQNALKHGLCAERFVVVGDEDPQAFAALESALEGELAPDGTLQRLLAGRIARAAWRLERADRIEAELGQHVPPTDALPTTQQPCDATVLAEVPKEPEPRTNADGFQATRGTSAGPSALPAALTGTRGAAMEPTGQACPGVAEGAGCRPPG